MDFKMDEQSYWDLNIFPFVFDLFKKTKTIGGRALIEHWMRNPTNVIDDLRRRTAAVDFITKTNIDLNIDHDQFDLILHYLNYDKGHLRGNVVDAFLPWARNRIKSNQNYYVVQVGVKYLLGLLKHSKVLTLSLSEADAPPLLIELATKINCLLEKPGISYAYSLATKDKLNFYELGKLDTTLRKANRLLLLDFLTIYYELDGLATLAKVAKAKDFCLPVYIENKNISITLTGLYHPAIVKARKNDILIDQHNNLTFLSGSNMAGKSSLLKSIGLAVYLAHIGFPVPAGSMRTIVFNGLITTINLADNIKNGLSHYYSEVMRVKKVASLLVAQDRMFVILDELFKGTNAKDAFDASLLVLNGFSAIPNSIFIVSSHITELATELTAKNIGFRYLEHVMVNGDPKFTYTLKEGIARDGIGMYFIEKEGILGLLKRASFTT